MSEALSVALAALCGYVIGTFPSADVVTKIVTRGQVDIRAQGSGNPGGLNAMRVVGRKWGIVVIVLDAAKGALAGFLGGAIGGDAGVYAGATAAIAGHCFPVWTRFRGGKGVATAGGSFVAAFPAMFFIAGAVAGVTVVATKRTEVTMWVTAAVWMIGAAVWVAADLDSWWGPAPGAGLLVYSALGAAMILGKFRAAALAHASAL